ncbi:MAG: T9SS type A sorting domain-containing protein [Bacteroidota bacterium]
MDFVFDNHFSPTSNHIVYLSDQETNNQVELFSMAFVCQENTIINDTPIADGTYAVATDLTSAGIVENDATVNFVAGQSITLKAGFHAKAGSRFSAQIGTISCFEPDVLASLSEERGQYTEVAAPAPIVETPPSVILTAQPNPFQYETELRFSLPEAQVTTIRLFDSVGRLVQMVLPRQRMEAGGHSVWLRNGGELRGFYFVILEMGGERVVRKVMVGS